MKKILLRKKKVKNKIVAASSKSSLRAKKNARHKKTAPTVTTKKSKKILSSLSLSKSPSNPIIAPYREHAWESWQTFNPGAILLNDAVHFLYRAIGEDGISRFGYAASYDGIHINERLSQPVYEHRIGAQPHTSFSYASGGSWGGAEDPRIVQVGNEDRLYMTYTACDGGLRVGLTSIRYDDFLNKKWKWAAPVLISPPREVHKNWVIFPEKINGKYAILHSLNPDVAIAYRDTLEFDGSTYIYSSHGGERRKHGWDKWVRGVGPVPVKTKYGWLVLYHAMDDDWSKYKVGAMLLDLEDPTKVLARSPEPVLEPGELYEHDGYKPGVVYASGAVIKDDTLLVYYGSADSYVCVASTPFEEFVEALAKSKMPKFKRVSPLVHARR